jgi:hypothetical protein
MGRQSQTGVLVRVDPHWILLPGSESGYIEVESWIQIWIRSETNSGPQH